MSEHCHLVWLREREATLVARIAQLTRELEHVQCEIRSPAAWSIDELQISVRAYNCLTTHAVTIDDQAWTRPTPKIETVGDLVQWSASDLLKIKNCGRSTVKEIEAIVSGLGLTLA